MSSSQNLLDSSKSSPRATRPKREQQVYSRNKGPALKNIPEVDSSSVHVHKSPAGPVRDCLNPWIAALVVFFLLDIISIVLIVKMAVVLSSKPSASKPVLESSGISRSLEEVPFCLPCSHVYRNRLEVVQNRFRVEVSKMAEVEAGEEMLCCEKKHSDLKTLVQRMFLDVQYSKDRASGQLTETIVMMDPENQTVIPPPHLMLFLDTEKSPSEINGTETVPLKASTEYTGSSIIFNGGSLTVTQDGLYYVYSNIPFNFTLDSPEVPLSQSLYRVRNYDHLLLMENSVYPCDVKAKQSCRDSFVAGIFRLETGDELSLRVSSHKCIDSEKDMHFGVQRL